MPERKIQILERALMRERAARKEAEDLLETKSKELYATGMQLRKSNERLQTLLDAKINELEGVFLNILDPYVVMDPAFNILRLNDAALEFLELESIPESFNLSELVHPDFLEYTARCVKQLFELGSLSNYRAKIFTAKGKERYVHINASIVFDDHNQLVGAQGIIRDISREKEIELLLEDQRQQLDNIFQNSPLGIYHFESGRVLKGNPTLAWMLGYSEQELPGLQVETFTQSGHAQDQTYPNPSHEAGILGTFTFTSLYRRKNGKEFWAKTTISPPFKDHKGRLRGVAIVEDITQKRLAEVQLVTSENRLSGLVANLNIGILLETEERTIFRVNQKFCEIFKIPVSPDDLIGMDCSNAAEQSKVFFADEDGFVSGILEILKNKKASAQDELLMKDGRILDRHYIRIGAGESFQGHLWTYTDITLNKNYERSLKLQREKYSSIIANMNLGLMEVDVNDTIQMVNQSFCEMTGFDEKELVGKAAAKIFKKGQSELARVKKELRLTRLSESYEVKLKDKSGRSRHWLISGAPRYDVAGQFKGTIGIHLDISHLKALEEEKEKLVRNLQNSNEELQEYAHIVSHDLKSPLRSISALVTWLIEDHREQLGPEGQVNLELIQEKIQAMENLITGILRYSQIQHDAESRQAVDLNEVVRQICDVIFIPSHVRVIPESLPIVQANSAQMHQLFQNLISNAVTHIPEGEGKVWVGCRELPRHWEFFVRDNGVGIAPEYHEKIFKIFQSIDVDRKGTGIGLSIVKKIVETYSGTIRLESQAGAGATFIFTIPKTDHGKA